MEDMSSYKDKQICSVVESLSQMSANHIALCDGSTEEIEISSIRDECSNEQKLVLQAINKRNPDMEHDLLVSYK